MKKCAFVQEPENGDDVLVRIDVSGFYMYFSFPRCLRFGRLILLYVLH